MLLFFTITIILFLDVLFSFIMLVIIGNVFQLITKLQYFILLQYCCLDMDECRRLAREGEKATRMGDAAKGKNI